MAKAKKLNKEFYKRRLYAKKFLDCQVHKSFLKDINISVLERQIIYQKISKYSINSSLSRFNNICMLTGRSRSVYRDVLLSRHKLNEMVLSGLIQGCVKVHGNLFFSIMRSSLAEMVSMIKVSLARRRLIAKVPYSNLNYNVLKILYFEGYIRGYKVNAELRKIYVFFKIVNSKLSLLDIAHFPSNNKFSHFPYKKLVSFYGLKNFGIVSTNTD